MITGTEGGSMGENKKKTILIIEDEEQLVASLQRLFRAQGYDVIAVTDAYGGISSARREQVDLIILDIGIPAGGGFFVLENIKVLIDTNPIPILVLTASTEPMVEEKAKKMGVSKYIHKPFDPESLIASVKELVGD